MNKQRRDPTPPPACVWALLLALPFVALLWAAEIALDRVRRK